MKKIFIIVIALITLVACSKQQTPQPVITPTPVPILQTIGCDSSVWKYEVLIDTLSNDNVEIEYRNEFGILVPVFLTVNTWSTTINFNGGTVFPIYFTLSSQVIHNISAMITLNIYRNGLLVETTGSVEFCNYFATSCPSTAVSYIDLEHICNQ